MTTPLRISIIICTCNRAESLSETLRALALVGIPAGVSAELVVVDNGSTDHTSEVAQNFAGTNMLMRLLHEPRRGQAFARNTGLAVAAGDVILFTDDDLCHPKDWLAAMLKPIRYEGSDAVIGGIRCAPSLERPWMTTDLRSWLACSDHLDESSPKELVGANMAFVRDVLGAVPRFDTELGPGARGYCDDTLFSAQLLKAGCRISAAFGTVSEHNFHPDRLLRASFLDAAKKMGRSRAYMDYHWEHRNLTALPLRRLRSRLRLARWRKSHPEELGRLEGISTQELEYAYSVSYFSAFYELAGAPRNYDRYGLIKRGTGTSVETTACAA